MTDTPLYTEVKAEYPDLEIPTCVALTYEECVEHAKPPIEPTSELPPGFTAETYSCGDQACKYYGQSHLHDEENHESKRQDPQT